MQGAKKDKSSRYLKFKHFTKLGSVAISKGKNRQKDILIYGFNQLRGKLKEVKVETHILCSDAFGSTTNIQHLT